MDMTKSEVRAALGFSLDRQLAEFFDVGKAAVSNWPENDPLPEIRQWQAHALRPDLFLRPLPNPRRKPKEGGPMTSGRKPLPALASPGVPQARAEQ